jgi:hypothetical protein
MRDWSAYGRELEAALDMRNPVPGAFRALFATGARFTDPANPSTDDLRSIQQQTRDVFPDWHQDVTSIRGGDDWAVFEWIGRATYEGIAVEMHGCSIIELDGDGLITSWRDYLDRKEPEQQIKRALKRNSTQ